MSFDREKQNQPFSGRNNDKNRHGNDRRDRTDFGSRKPSFDRDDTSGKYGNDRRDRTDFGSRKPSFDRDDTSGKYGNDRRDRTDFGSRKPSFDRGDTSGKYGNDRRDRTDFGSRKPSFDRDDTSGKYGNDRRDRTDFGSRKPSFDRGDTSGKYGNDRRDRTDFGSRKPSFDRGDTSGKYGNDRRDLEADSDDRSRKKASERDDLIIGRNAAREALQSGRAIDSVLVAKGEKTGALPPLIAECRQRDIPVKEVDRKKLDFMCGHGNHQGVIMVAAAHEYSTVEAILNSAHEKNEKPFIIICDSIEDPHNLGAIIRSAECCGAHGIIIPERRSAGLSGIVGKTSAGALEYMPVARVTNLTETIKQLKKEGIWVFCADMDGTPYREADLSGAIALVIGSEGSGVSRLVKENCDGVLSIPMKGNINSLNASVAAAILMFETAHAR